MSLRVKIAREVWKHIGPEDETEVAKYGTPEGVRRGWLKRKALDAIYRFRQAQRQAQGVPDRYARSRLRQLAAEAQDAAVEAWRAEPATKHLKGTAFDHDQQSHAGDDMSQRIRAWEKKYGIQEGITKIPDYSADFGLSPGKYRAYRFGQSNNVEPRGLFFSADKGGAEWYADGGPVQVYDLDVKNPAVYEDMIEALTDLFGGTRQDWLAKRNKAKIVNDWWRAHDRKVYLELKKRGHDAITYLSPAPPATREIVILDPGVISLLGEANA